MKRKNKLIFTCILALVICALLLPCSFAEEGEEAVVTEEAVEPQAVGRSEEAVEEVAEEAVEETVEGEEAVGRSAEAVEEEIPEEAVEPQAEGRSDEVGEEVVPADETIVISEEEETNPEIPEEISNPELQGDDKSTCYAAQFYGLNDASAMLKGGEEANLNEFVRSLGYEGEIESAVSSNPEAVEIANGMIRILSPFGDETITLVIGGQEVTIKVHDPKPVTDIVTQFAAGGDFFLESDIEIENGVLTVPEGKTVILDLKGHTLSGGKDGTKGSVITVNGTFTLKDSRTQSLHKGYVDANGLWHLDENSEHILSEGETRKSIFGGVITGGTGTQTKSGQYDGGGVYNNGTFTMNGGTIAGNTAGENQTDKRGGGGGVLNNGTFTLDGGTISGNTTGVSGGGVYNTGEFFLESGKISDNKGYYTGAVVNDADGKFTMNGGEITGNKADDNVGGVGNSGTFNMNGGTISGNISGASGGGVYNMARGKFTMFDGALSGNTATGNGGGVYGDNGSKFTMRGGIITSNEAVNGGGIYNNGGTVGIAFESSIINNNATGNGGGLYTASGTVQVMSGTIDENEASDGAGVYVASGDFTMSSGTISGNIAAGNGGGLYNSGTSYVWNTTVSGNIATNGGGIYTDGFIGFTDSKLSDNTAAGNGGGAYVGNGGRFESVRGEISECCASGNGGGVYVDNGATATFATNYGSDIKVTNCTAIGNGGGIYSNGAVGLGTCSISANAAEGEGDGIYLDSDGTIFVGEKAKVTGNSASNLYLRDGALVTIGTGADVPAPAKGMSIGVTTENEPALGGFVPITTNGKSGDELFFISDTGKYPIIFDGVVKLVNPAPPAPEEAVGYVSVYVDDELLTEGKDYNWVNGKIVFTAEFLETLEEGEHELKVVFPGFTVKESFSFTDGAVVPAEDAKYLTV